MKHCKNCKQTKSAEHFYKDTRYADGLRTPCKDCCREYKRAYYLDPEKADRKRAQDRQRQSKPEVREHRNQTARLYRQTPRFKELMAAQRIKHKAKWAACDKLHTAVRYGKVKRGECAVCGCAKVEGHHEDYSKPLEVVWLCKKHHVELHRNP